MKARIVLFLIIQAIASLVCSQSPFAWTGETWGPISRETILRRSSEMIELSWSPLKQITNYGYVYSPGKTYRGEAYFYGGSQNFGEFYASVNKTSGGTTSYGNDCSAFASIAWKLPERYDTTKFESDAKSDGGYVTKLGEIDSCQSVSRALLPGDAFVKSGKHILLFDRLSYNAQGYNDGIWALEQTVDSIEEVHWAVRDSYWSWSKLASYRPIRRNLVDEGNYYFVTKWGTEGLGNGQFQSPTDLVVDVSGNIYVADRYNNRIQKFDRNGNFITKWGYFYEASNPPGGSFVAPYTMAIDASGYIYVLDSEGWSKRSRMQKFDNNGSFRSAWPEFPSQTQLGGFTVDNGGNVHLCTSWLLNGHDYCGIREFSNSGALIATWGDVYECSNYAYGYGPIRIARDGYGNFYVSEVISGSGHRIKKYNSGFSFVTKWGSCCLCDTCPGIFFNGPKGIAVDSSGNVYVADSDNNRIQKFDSNGNFLAKWGEYGFAYGENEENGNFLYPEGVAVDSSLNVYVADTYNNRIQKFKPVSPYPSKPLSLTATTVSSSRIDLSWVDNSNNENGFNVVRKQGIRGEYSVIKEDLPPNTTTFTDSVPGPDTYYYTVYAKSGTLYSAYSNEASATITQLPPAAPTNLTVNAVTYDEIVISWTDNSTTETGFIIERMVVSESSSIQAATAGTWEEIGTVGQDVTQFSDAGLSPGTTYAYRVTAYNSTGDSAPSNEITGTTIALSCAASARILGSSTTYSTLQAAYNAASNGAVIQSPAVTFTENLSIDRSISVTLDGGYNCDYTGKVARTTLKGAVKTTGGIATFGDFLLQK